MFRKKFHDKDEKYIIEETIVIDLPKEVCVEKGYIFDENSRKCIMKIQRDLRKPKEVKIFIFGR